MANNKVRKNHPSNQHAQNKPANNGQLVHQQSWKGPLPPPAALNSYEVIVPGAAERILSMAEKEQAARHSNDEKFAELASRELTQGGQDVRRGQWLGFSSIITCLGLAFASAYLKFNPVISVAFTAIPVLSAIKTIINRRHSRNK